MYRILSIDYGSKRCGLAVTDPLRIIASGLDAVERQELMPYLKKYISKENVKIIVIGEPRQKDFSHSSIEAEIKELIKELNIVFPNILIERIDERYTSKLASNAILQSGAKKSTRRDKSLIDMVSATIILQSYLEKFCN